MNGQSDEEYPPPSAIFQNRYLIGCDRTVSSLRTAIFIVAQTVSSTFTNIR